MTYLDSGFSNFLTRAKPVPAQDTEDVASYKTPALPASSLATPVPKDKVKDALDSLVKISEPLTAISGSVSNGSGVRLTTTVSDRSYKAKVFFC